MKITTAITKLTRCLMAFGLLFFGSNLDALASQKGTSTATFLRIGKGARAEGMGGAHTAVTNDAQAIYWNPAGLSRIERRQITMEHNQFIEEMNSQFAAFAIPLGGMPGAVGVSGTFVDMGDIERYDASGVKQSGDTAVRAYSGTLAWGQSLGGAIAFGAGIKYFSQDLAGEKGSGAAGDVGLLINLVPEKFTLGGAFSNIGPKIETGTREESLPQTLRGGAAFYAIPRQLVFAVDVEKERDTDAKIHGGAELTYMKRFIARLGYQETHEATGGFSAGLGFIWRPAERKSLDFVKNHESTQAKYGDKEGVIVRIDYGFVDYGDFDTTHRVGVNLIF